MKNKIFIVLLISIMPFMVYAQDAPIKHTKHKTTANNTKTKKTPEWAQAHNYDASSHVYFPDYYTFYDPNRGGYVFWEKGNWSFTPTVPAFLTKVDLSRSRIQILKGLSLDLHPELDYPYYMEMYPAEHDNNMAPVPIPGNPAFNN